MWGDPGGLSQYEEGTHGHMDQGGTVADRWAAPASPYLGLAPVSWLTLEFPGQRQPPARGLVLLFVPTGKTLESHGVLVFSFRAKGHPRDGDGNFAHSSFYWSVLQSKGLTILVKDSGNVGVGGQ